MKIQIYFFIGTIAELIKLAVVLERFKKEKIHFKIITSGQNEINFQELEPVVGKQKSDINLPFKSRESSTIKFILWAIKTFFISLYRLSKEFKKIDKKNIYFIVLGDTISTLLGALVGKFYGLSVVHIEAGYRSFNSLEPFPEELTRVIVSYLADVHFCPDKWSLNNLKNHKGIKISTGENTLYETSMKASKANVKPRVLSQINQKRFFLLILHRQEHMLYKEDLTKKYIEVLTSFANNKLKCVFILHQLTEDFLKRENLLDKIKKNPNIITVPRLPYLEFQQVIERSEFIATDGGGNQAEAYFFGKPCLLLRKYTEQMEGVGSNIVLAEDNISIVRDFLVNYKKFKREKVKLKIMPSSIVAKFFKNKQ